VPEKELSVAERAVARFDEAKEELFTFMADPEIKDILLEYEQLVGEYNRQLDAASRAVKTQLRTLDQDKLVVGVVGAQKKYKRYYDVDFLANTLPAEQADLVLTETVTYKLDADLLHQLVRQGEVDNELVAKAYHEDEQAPANMPGTPKPYVIPSVPIDD
jgi:hypothetical protein